MTVPRSDSARNAGAWPHWYVQSLQRFCQWAEIRLAQCDALVRFVGTTCPVEWKSLVVESHNRLNVSPPLTASFPISSVGRNDPLAAHDSHMAPTSPFNGNSFCSFRAWLQDVVVKHGRRSQRDSLYVDFREGEIEVVLSCVRAACDRLEATELFGPNDDALLASGGPERNRKPGFTGWVAAKPAEIRVALVLRCCEPYIIEKGEVCPAWIKPFPPEPVTSVAALANYLDRQMEQWCQAESRSSGTAPSNAAEEWRVLDNVQHTLAWFRRCEVIRSLPSVPGFRRTRLNAGRCAEIWRQALKELLQGHAHLPASAHQQVEGGSKCCVVLRGKGASPLVLGREVPPVTSARHDVLHALVNAGPDGLSLKELIRASGHGSARNVLKGLAGTSSVWQQVILLPGAPGRRYRLLFQ